MRDPGHARGEVFRGFVALPLPREVRERAGAVVERLRAGADVRWTTTENFHLTLKYLGPVPRGSLPELNAALDEAAGASSPFSLSLGGLGAFPRLDRPQVIWIGVTGGDEPLGALAARVEAACVGVGFSPEERSFRGHLTLGRRRDARGGLPARQTRNGLPLPERLRATGSVDLGRFAVDRFHLMQSDLTGISPIYTVVSTFQLGSGVREGAPVG
jgi:2'-5' RNA ligase